ncbi:MAG: ABC transporter ATP-binding protein [Acidimicrobiales bacterium]
MTVAAGWHPIVLQLDAALDIDACSRSVRPLYRACMPAISVEDLSVHYRRDRDAVKAVDGVTFDVEPGEVLVLLGPNGAGKTSTVETLEGYRNATSGRVRVLDLDPIEDHGPLMMHVGIMLQQGGIHPGMRVIEALRLYAAFYPDPIEPGFLLQRMGLGDRARSTWRQLSGGEQQRLSLALALIGKPRVVFLDEPTSGLDVSGRQIVRDVIRTLRDDGVAVLLTTHELGEAQRLADRVVIIDHGRMVAAGTLAELMHTGEDHGIHFGAPAKLDVGALTERMGAPVIEVSPGEYRLDSPPTPVVIADLTAWLSEQNLPLADLRAGRHSLEDVFLRLTGRQEQGESHA